MANMFEQQVVAQMKKMPLEQLKTAINRARALVQYQGAQEAAIAAIKAETGKTLYPSKVKADAEILVRLGQAELNRRLS